MLLQHHHEHLGVADRAGVKQLHAGNLTADGHHSPRPNEIRRERRRARHICSIQNQTRFQAPSGAEYAAPTGLGNGVARVATKISLLTERRTGTPK